MFFNFQLLAVWLNSFQEPRWSTAADYANERFEVENACYVSFVVAPLSAADAFVYILNKQECVNIMSVDKSIFRVTL